MQMFSLFNHYLPSTLSIQIKKHRIHLVVLQKTAKSAYQMNHYSSSHSEDALLNDKDAFTNPHLIANLIQQQLQDYKPKISSLAAYISDSNTIHHTTHMHNSLKKTDIESLLQSDISQYIPYPSDETAFDFNIAAINNNTDSRHVQITACKKQYLGHYQDLALAIETPLKLLSAEKEVKHLAMQYIVDSVLGQEQLNTILFLDILPRAYSIAIMDKQSEIYSRHTDAYNDDTRQKQGSLFGKQLPKDHSDVPKTKSNYLKYEIAPVIEEEIRLFKQSHSNRLDAVVISGINDDHITSNIHINSHIPVFFANPFLRLTQAEQVNNALLTQDAPKLLPLFGAALAALNQ